MTVEENLTSVENKEHKRDLSVSMLDANIYAVLITIPFLILLPVFYLLVWGFEGMVESLLAMLSRLNDQFYMFLLFWLVFMAGIVVHELIHGITWAVIGKRPWSSIKFGFQLKTLTPYCHIKEPLQLGPYRWGAVMPGILTGFLPALLGIFLNNMALFGMGFLFVLAAGGDLYILWTLRKEKTGVWVEDHPTRAGCYVLDSLEQE